MSNFLDQIRSQIELVNKNLGDFFNRIKNRDLGSNQLIKDFYTELENYCIRGGKRLRPLSLINTYRGLGGKTDEIYKLSICVELLHNASLIHDDIVDNDELRRNEPTFHVYFREWSAIAFPGKERPLIDDRVDEKISNELDESFGVNMGIMGGDYLLDLGLIPILDSNFPPELKINALKSYQIAFQDLVEGEILEFYLQNKKIAAEKSYDQVIAGKTSALFTHSLLIGASLIPASDIQLQILSKFGRIYGKAFQMQDDIMGTFGNPDKMGKSNDGDISNNKGNADCWIVKLTSTGGIAWEKSLGGSSGDVAHSVQQTTDGGYIIAGESSSNDGDVTENQGGSDFWIVKLDSSGEFEWQKSLGGSLTDAAYSIEQASDGSYVIAGESDSNDGDVSGNHGDYDFWIVKLNKN